MPFPRFRQAEVLPVPQEKIALLWKCAARFLRTIPNYDLDRARVRLLSGQDRLWLAAMTVGKQSSWWYKDPYIAAIVTTVSDGQPFKWKPPKLFQRKDPTLRRSLKVHMVGESPMAWIDSAVERITAYGKEQKCRMLFLSTRQGWRKHATSFWAPDWELVAHTRDRPTKGRGGKGPKHYPGWNKVGNYRIMQPLKEMRGQDYNSGTMCYFQEHAA